jgi:O-acetyl-ADP-ribose deacetylase (regulator of RNase III)
MKEIEGDLIDLAKRGHFDVVTHGCNCFCTMGAGIAPQMVWALAKRANS